MVPKSVQGLQSHESLCDDARVSAFGHGTSFYLQGLWTLARHRFYWPMFWKKNSRSCSTKSNQCQRYAYVYVEFFSIFLLQNYCIIPEIGPRGKMSVKIVCSEKVVMSPFYVRSISISTVAKYGSLGKWICRCKFLKYLHLLYRTNKPTVFLTWAPLSET